MLRFTKLEISNFGPYQGTQVLELPSDDGVVIVWGFNGVGKTSIMRAIRFALWGKIVDEHDNEEPISSFVNHEAVERGENMTIVLHMEYDGDSYVLTRCLERRKDTYGLSDSDYSLDIFLSKNGDIVSTSDRDHFLKTAIPEDISRFYLFDGELLQQYENLLKSGNDNSIIKDSIEDILGLPILEKSCDSLSVIRKGYFDTFTKASAADTRTREAGIKLAGLEEKDEELKANLKEYQDKLTQAIADRGKIDDKLNETAAYRSHTHEIKTRESQINELEEELVTLKDDLRDDLDSLWEAHLKSVIESEITSKENEQKTLSEKLGKQNEYQAIYGIISKLLKEHGCNCPVCNSLIDDKGYAFLKEKAEVYSNSTDQSLQREYTRLTAEIVNLRGLKCEDKTAMIKNNLVAIDKVTTKIALKTLEKERLEKERRTIGSDNDESSIEKLMPERDRISDLISTYKAGVEAEKRAIEDNQSDIERVRKKLKGEQSNTEIQKAQNDLDSCQEVVDLFKDAIEKFKENLKENVQKDATEYFKSVAANPEYKELVINDEYGLEILTETGVKVPHRSSGYVQVVAISLIAALHKNAPISGPIIMDSTFQRIDPRHKTNILKSLPSLGQQVIVLAYPEEIQESTARNVLLGKLKKEIELEQLSAFNTVIKK